MELPTIAFSKDFLALLKMSESAAYSLKPVFAARCEKYSSTARYLERAVVITQGGELILFDTTDKQLRMTHRIQLGKERPHKKLIVLVDREPYEKDLKQSIRILTEPLSPTDDEPRWDALSGETEDEFKRRIRAEDASMGKLLPDEDLILTFHCKRGPITTQAVSIIRHYALPIGDFFVELQDEPILKQASRERSLLDVIRNLAKGKKTAKPVALNAIARQKLAEAEEAGEEIAIPEPVQAPRQGGSKKAVIVTGSGRHTGIVEDDILPDARLGVTMRQIESQAKLRRHRERAARQMGGQEICDEDYDDLEDDEIIDHLPEYMFDEPDPEDVEAMKNRKRKPQRPPLDEIEFPSESDGLEESEESDGRTKRKLKSDKKSSKRAKKEQERLQKQREKKEERARRKESKRRLTEAIAAREEERLHAGYRYSLEYTDTLSKQQPEALYRAHSNKKGVPLFKIRAPADEDSLALTSLCFYRRNMVILLNPAMAPDDEESVSVAVASAGQFLVCRTHSQNDDDQEDLGASGRGFPLNAVTKCLIEYSNRYVNDQRIGYVTLTIDVNMNPKKLKKREAKAKIIRKRREAKEKRKAQRQKQRAKQREQRRQERGRGRNGDDEELDEDGNPIYQEDDAFDEEVEEEDEEEMEEEQEDDDTESRDRRKRKSKRHSDDDEDDYGDNGDDRSGSSDDTATEDEIDLRTVEMEFDDISCGDMNADDAECCSLEYFVTVLKHFNPLVVVKVEEPPPEVEEQDDSQQDNVSMTSSEYRERVPPSAILAERMVTSASMRAAGREGVTAPEELPTNPRNLKLGPRSANSVGGGFGGLLNSRSDSQNSQVQHHIDVAGHNLSTSRLKALTPQAIQQRGEELRKMISTHKLQQQESPSTKGNTADDTAELSRSRAAQHRALTKLIFDVTEKNLATLRRRASASAALGASAAAAPAGGSTGALAYKARPVPNPQTLMRFRDIEARTGSGAPPAVIGAGSPSSFYPFPGKSRIVAPAGANVAAAPRRTAAVSGSSPATSTREGSSSIGSTQSQRVHLQGVTPRQPQRHASSSQGSGSSRR